MKGESRFNRVSVLPSLIFSVAVSWSVQGAEPETYKPMEIKTEYQYAAKIVCSLLLPQQDGTLARGTYRTIVNIHNPTEKPITIAAKVALATEFGADPGPFAITPFHKAELQPDGATELNCFNFAGFFCPINGVCVDFAFLEGFAVIKSPVPLDVVGVYTARHTDDEVETMDVETIQPRPLRETVAIGPADGRTDIKKHMEYPTKGSVAYGGKDQPKQLCGGIAGIACPNNKVCVDDPSDDCNPAKGGSDCSGVCVNSQVKKY
jgi:hypothetical protein